MRHDDLSDEEVVEMILESLEEDGRVRTEFLKVECYQGRPVLAGRVGSDEELQIMEEILNDVLDLHDYENNVWVDDSLAFAVAEDDERGAGDAGGDNELETDQTFEPDDEEEEK